MVSFTSGVYPILGILYTAYRQCMHELRSLHPFKSCFSIIPGTALLQFFLAVEAATVQLLDKSLFQAASTATPSSSASTSPGGGQRRDNYAARPQLMMVGPVGVVVASTRHAASGPGDGNSGLGASHGFRHPSTPTSPISRSQVSPTTVAYPQWSGSFLVGVVERAFWLV